MHGAFSYAAYNMVIEVRTEWLTVNMSRSDIV